ncbi:MAG: hypothetical protein ACLVJ6_13650 [Merdibacter sp.]
MRRSLSGLSLPAAFRTLGEAHMNAGAYKSEIASLSVRLVYREERLNGGQRELITHTGIRPFSGIRIGASGRRLQLTTGISVRSVR